MATATANHTFGAVLRLSRSLVKDGTVERLDQTAEGMANSVLLQFERTGGDGWALIEPRVEITVEPHRFVIECVSAKVNTEAAFAWRERAFMRSRLHENVVQAMRVAADRWVKEEYGAVVVADQANVVAR